MSVGLGTMEHRANYPPDMRKKVGIWHTFSTDRSEA